MRTCWFDIQAAACELEGISESPEQDMDPSFYSPLLQDRDSEESGPDDAPDHASNSQDDRGQPQGSESDCRTIVTRFYNVAAPYWSSEDKLQARVRLALVFTLTLATTAISVSYSFLGRDFYNALASKDAKLFKRQLIFYLLAFLGGIPVFVIRDYMRDLLAMRWRSWLTSRYIELYFKNRTFYNIEAQSLVDNPDQRIVQDVNTFTATALAFALAIFNAAVDLISFSSILYGIYPPLFLVLIGYSLVGTFCSVMLGKGLVGLNFKQEKTEAELRYGLLRVRENAESIAFYGGEKSEVRHLLRCFMQSLDNLIKLLVVSRNLNFFTSGYRYIIQLLPAAVVAKIYFSGKIDFGVINQSFAAFDHILGDLSIVVYQFQSITAFTAVVDRLGGFTDVLGGTNAGPRTTGLHVDVTAGAQPKINKIDTFECNNSCDSVSQPLPLLSVERLTLHTPRYTMILVEDLSFAIYQGQHLLVMGPSGSGKTSLLRAIAGLWQSGKGTIRTYLRCCENELDRHVVQEGEYSDAVSSHQVYGEIEEESHDNRREDQWSGSMIFFLPQKPYMVQGSLRQQLLYPTWITVADRTDDSTSVTIIPVESPRCSQIRPPPDDDELLEVLARVKLSHLRSRCDGLDSNVEWATMLSQGEQQRIAFARLLLSRPRLALMDESTSAMDEENEAHLYREVQAIGVTFVSVAHRGSLGRFHTNILTLSSSDMREKGFTWDMKPSDAFGFD